MGLEGYDTFEAVKSRLDEIVDAVQADDLPLDDALALYEEAVGLGLRASDLLEENITAEQDDGESTEDEAKSIDGVDDGAFDPADASAVSEEAVLSAASSPRELSAE